MARATERSGRACATRACARRRSACAAFVGRSVHWTDLRSSSLRENDLLAATRTGRPRGPHAHDGTIIPEAIDAMWGTDMTAAFTVEHGQVAVFVAVDHCSAECTGHPRGAARHAARGARADPAGRGRTFRCRRQGHGRRPQHPPRPWEPVHVPRLPARDRLARRDVLAGPHTCPRGQRLWPKRFIRTLKENLLWVRTFRTVEELRLALIEFRRTYNEHWPIERHGHRSPAQFRRGQMDAAPLAA